MPKGLNSHFRETEIRIVSEAAWTNGSPVVEIIKDIFKTQNKDSTLTPEEEEEIRIRQE